MSKLATVLGLLLTLASAQAHYPNDQSQPLTRIAFGSCNRQTEAQTIWPSISGTQPDLWVWMGDNVYADATELSKLKATYESQLSNPLYAEFRARTPIIGTWDDHDYGENNGDKRYRLKDESQKLLLSFLQEPETSPRWRQRGVYATTTFGPIGKRLQLFLLDLRYFREAPGKSAELLGQEQWAWLKSELASSDAQLKLIVSSTQVALRAPFGETWTDYPRERARLFKLIADLHVSGVIFLSGDKHLGVIDRLEPRRDGVSYPLYDVTSSGLTHAVKGEKLVAARLIYGPKLFAERNFGTLEVDWNASPVTIRLNLHDLSGNVARSQALTLDELQFSRR